MDALETLPFDVNDPEVGGDAEGEESEGGETDDLEISDACDDLEEQLPFHESQPDPYDMEEHEVASEEEEEGKKNQERKKNQEKQEVSEVQEAKQKEATLLEQPDLGTRGEEEESDDENDKNPAKGVHKDSTWNVF